MQRMCGEVTMTIGGEEHVMEKANEPRRKKPYEKPTVVRFPLRPEEAVLGFCKTTGGNGPSGGNCFSFGICRIAGS